MPNEQPRRKIEEMGYGEIRGEGDKIFYEGSLPFSTGERVVMLRESHLQSIINAELTLLLAHRNRMLPEMFRFPEGEENDCRSCSHLPDEIFIQRRSDKAVHKLFLDRSGSYSNKPTDYLFISYVS